MIVINPGMNFEFNNSDKSANEVVEELKRIIVAVSPFRNRIRFHNNTKHCMITVSFNDDVIEVAFKNPDDERFDVGENIEPSITANQIRIRSALLGIIQLGKRDLSNPKYDEYFNEANEALNEP